MMSPMWHSDSANLVTASDKYVARLLMFNSL
jgi:hypothetical protein